MVIRVPVTGLSLFRDTMPFKARNPKLEQVLLKRKEENRIAEGITA